jgi:hypothetical protein
MAYLGFGPRIAKPFAQLFQLAGVEARRLLQRQ